jgi:hypothetical protein
LTSALPRTTFGQVVRIKKKENLMLTRTSLLVVATAALTVAGLNVFWMHRQITTAITQRNQARAEREQESSARLQAQQQARNEHAALQNATQALAIASDERDKAVAAAQAKTDRAAKLVAAIRQTATDRDRATNELARWQMGITVDQVRPAIASLTALREEREALGQENALLTAKCEKLEWKLVYSEPDTLELPEGLKGKVVAVDPKYEFVVLDIGDKQGALEDGQMLETRNGKLVARIKITRVDSDRSIASVMPGWKLAEVMEGDQVQLPQ